MLSLIYNIYNSYVLCAKGYDQHDAANALIDYFIKFFLLISQSNASKQSVVNL